MRILEHFNVLRDTIHGRVEADHLHWEVDQFAGAEPVIFDIKMGEEVSGGDGGVERVGMSKITVPHFLDSIVDELGCRTFSSIIGGVVADPDGVFCLRPCPDDGRCIVSNKGVSWGPLWDGKWGTPDVSVRG